MYYTYNSSNVTVSNNNGYQCNTCQASYYISNINISSPSQCLPCSILCIQCYGNHFGRCTACASNAVLYNQMCIPLPYVSNSVMQLYYTPTHSSK